MVSEKPPEYACNNSEYLEDLEQLTYICGIECVDAGVVGSFDMLQSLFFIQNPGLMVSWNAIAKASQDYPRDLESGGSQSYCRYVRSK